MVLDWLPIHRYFIKGFKVIVRSASMKELYLLVEILTGHVTPNIAFFLLKEMNFEIFYIVVKEMEKTINERKVFHISPQRQVSLEDI